MTRDRITPSCGNGASVRSPEDSELAQVLETYLKATETGQAVDVERLVAEHPAIADRLRACLSVLEAASQVAGVRGEMLVAGDGAGQGARIGDYRILRQAGRGAMGIVYEAEQVSLCRRVALKMLPFAAALDPQHLARFQLEAQAAARLHHTHIVPIFAVGCERGVHYYAMQFIEGRTLAALIGDLRGHEDPPHARPIFLGFAERATDRDNPPNRSRAFFLAVARLGIQAAEAENPRARLAAELLASTAYGSTAAHLDSTAIWEVP